MLVQIYMYVHHTGRHERLSGKLCWSSHTYTYTIQADSNLCQANYDGPALHVLTPLRQTQMLVKQIILVQFYMCLYKTGKHKHLSGKLYWSSSVHVLKQGRHELPSGKFAGLF